MKEINAVGLICPRPVIMAKKALEKHDRIMITVDNLMSKENLEKMAKVMALECVTKEINGNYQVNLMKTVNVESPKEEKGDYIVVIDSIYLGKGDDQLGEALMKSFIYTLAESEQLPSRIIFYNSGVKLTTKGSTVVEDLKKMSACGTEILSCGACLNFFQLEAQLEVGEVTNMYQILTLQQQAKKIIKA